MIVATLHIAVFAAAPHGALREVADLVGRHGYLIIFILIAAESFAFPLPGEVSLLVGAYEAQRGIFGLGWVIAIGASAAIVGDNLAYLFGRHAGRALIERLLRALHVRAAHLERVDAYFGRHAALTVFVARQLSPVRGLTALSAGSSHVPWRRFVVFNALGCVVWATVVTLIASLFVSRLDELADDLSLAGVVVVGLLLVGLALLAWRRLKHNVVRSVELADVERIDAEQKCGAADRDLGPEVPQTSLDDRCLKEARVPCRSTRPETQAS